jgi:ankyrin repeat protein
MEARTTRNPQRQDRQGGSFLENPLPGASILSPLWSSRVFRCCISGACAILLVFPLTARSQSKPDHPRGPEQHDPLPAQKEPANQQERGKQNDSAANPESPLIAAARSGDAARVTELLAKGASEDVHNVNLETPLFVAASRGHIEVVRVLVDASAGIDIPDRDGRTPLFAAAASGHREIVEFLLDNGANPNSSRNTGETPLFMAAESGHIEIVRALLKMGALPTVTDSRGRTPLQMARERDNKDLVELLLKFHARMPDKNARATAGPPPDKASK